MIAAMSPKIPLDAAAVEVYPSPRDRADVTQRSMNGLEGRTPHVTTCLPAQFIPTVVALAHTAWFGGTFFVAEVGSPGEVSR